MTKEIQEALVSDVFKDTLLGEYTNNVIYAHPERNRVLNGFLQEVGIDLDANIVLTVMIDNFWTTYEKEDNSSRYKVKRDLLTRTREGIAYFQLQAVAATLIGTDKVVILLEAPGETAEDAENYAELWANALHTYLSEGCDYSISIGVSDYCGTSNAMWRAYEQSFRALENTFVSGYGKVLRYSYIAKNSYEFTKKEKEKLVKEFILDISMGNSTQCRQHTELLFGKLRMMEIDSSYTKSMLILILSDVLQFFAQNTVYQGNVAQGILDVVKQIFQSGTLQDIQDVTWNCLNSLLQINQRELHYHDMVMDAARTYISQFCSEPLTCEEMAEFCSYSTGHFSRSFKNRFKVTFLEYLRMCRIAKAKDYLENTALTANEIALKSGFTNYSHFCTVFKKAEGISPSHYRMRKRMISTESRGC